MNATARYSLNPGAPSGYARRMSLYLSEMFPVPLRAVSSALFFTSFAFLLGKIHAVRVPLISWLALQGSASVFLLLLTLRLMDELKDREIDAALFRERPLPSGKVLESDVRFSILVSVSLYFIVNLFRPGSLAAAAVVMGYAFLMLKFFFIPQAIRNNLLLALATHNPIVGLMLAYCAVLVGASVTVPPGARHTGQVILLIVMYWAMSFAWEVCRKIRCEEEENEYVTYSRIFGRAGSVALAAGAQTVTAVIAVSFRSSLGLSPLYTGIVLTGYAAVVAGHARFLMHPDPRTSKLRPWGELFMISVLAAGFIEGMIS